MNEKTRWAPGAWRITVAALLIAASCVKDVSIGTVTLAGGPGLAALAALVIAWPILVELGKHGGSTEFLGLRMQINSIAQSTEEIERNAEEELGVGLEELRGDLEDLRVEIQRLKGDSAEALGTAQAPAFSAELFNNAVREYREHLATPEWRARVEVDKRLAGAAGSFPVDFLRERVEMSNGDMCVGMAAAVALGGPRPAGERLSSAKLLIELLGFPFERVRHRAARSIERRARRSDFSNEERTLFLEALASAAKPQNALVVNDAIDEAYDVVYNASARDPANPPAGADG